MSYCTPADVFNTFPRVLTSGLTPVEVDPLCERWSDYMDGFLAIRYPTPMAQAPLLRMLASELVMLDILGRTPNAPDWVRTRRNDVDAVLQAIAEGKQIVPNAQQRTDLNAPVTNLSGRTRVFGAVPSLGERYDPDRVQAETDARKLT